MHPQLAGSGRWAWSPDPAQQRALLECRPSRARGVILTLIEQEQGVPAELEQAAAERVRLVEERREGGVHDVRDLFGAGPAAARQHLRHRSEARDVDERER